jgi:flagellar assembly factor FliW
LILLAEMQLNTLQLGSLEVSEQDIICFESGLPGFPELKRFVLCNAEDLEPFKYQLSVDRPEIAFLLVAPALIDARYRVALNEEARDTLHWEENHTLAVYATVTLSPKVEETTANFLAPIIINATNMHGFQMIQEAGGYSVRYRILDSVPQAL